MTTGLPPASAETAGAAHDGLRANVLCGHRWGHTSLLILAAFTVTLAAHRQTALEAVDIWHRSYTYAYAWLVLPALLFLLWQNRTRLAAIAPKHSLSAWVPAVLFAGLWVIGDLANIAVIRQFALVASLGTIVLGGVGWPAFGRLAPYVVLLFFCVPAADVLLEPLKSIAVNVVRIYTAIIGIAFEQDGFSMTIGANRYVTTAQVSSTRSREASSGSSWRCRSIHTRSKRRRLRSSEARPVSHRTGSASSRSSPTTTRPVRS